MASLSHRLDVLEQTFRPANREGTLADLILCARGDHEHAPGVECDRFAFVWLPALVEQL